jgi:hypothetical protein
LLNRCVFNKIVGALKTPGVAQLTLHQGLEKTIPDTPKGETPVHLRDFQIYADRQKVVRPWEVDVGIRKDGKPV